jgi:hypothetical protein
VPVRIFKEAIEVTNRLGDLATSSEQLLEVVGAVVAARADCTDNDPFGSRGWRGWQMGTRRSREVHVGADGWEKDDTDQVPAIINKRFGIRIVICNTDDGTSIEMGKPQNRHKKGSATNRAIDANQGSFMDRLDETVSVISIAKRRTSATGAILTYFLCVYAEGDDIRAELSCPVNVENGFFDDFVERIFIIGGDTGESSPARRRKPDDDIQGGSEYSIPVIRKK